MRSGPVSMFKTSTHPLVLAVRDIADAIVIENDGDEIPTAGALYHLKHCEVKTGDAHVGLPSIFYKHSTHVLCGNKEIAWYNKWVAQGLDNHKALHAWATHWWVAAPTIVKLKEVSLMVPS